MHATFDDIRPTRRLEQPQRPRKRRRGVSVRTAAIVAILFAAGLVLISGRDPAPRPPETRWSPRRRRNGSISLTRSSFRSLGTAARASAAKLCRPAQ